MLTITREEFLEIYQGLACCEYVDLFYSEPLNDLDYVNNYLTSKLWRLNNCYTIVNKMGERVIFNMNRAQHMVYAKSLWHPRIIILKSRQQGISTLWLVSFFDDTVTKRDYSVGLMAQGLDESQRLLERVGILWDELHPSIKAYIGVSLGKDNTKEFSLSNGSSIFIRTSFRSTTLQRLHISEMGKIANKNPEKAKETKTGTLQALAQGNIGVVESTAEGDNMFKDMWDNAVKFSGQITPKDFLPIFLSWLDDPDCNVEVDQFATPKQEKYFEELELELGRKLTRAQKNFWIAQYRELGDKIYQEYPSTPIEAFMATKDGAYYAKLYLQYVRGLNREIKNLYDKNLDVQVAIDLGMNDTNALTVFQDYIDDTRIIDEFADSGQPIRYYCDWIKKQPWFRNLRHVILPHDAEVTELTSGKTRTEVFEELLCWNDDGTHNGILVTVLPRLGINEGIDMVRELLRTLYIDPRCSYIIDCIYNYTKEWDEKRERWRDKPEHNEYSNGADSVRYLAMGREKYINHTSYHAGRKKDFDDDDGSDGVEHDV